MKKGYTKKRFVKLSKMKHGERYCYKDSVYHGANKKVEVLCRDHGKFTIVQARHHYTRGDGCKICSASNPEKLIVDFLNSNGVDFEFQYSFDGLLLKYPLKIDFLLYLEEDVALEYHGRQHYEEVGLWGGKEKLELIKKSDALKVDYCKKNNIPYYEFNHLQSDEEIIKKLKKICKK